MEKFYRINDGWYLSTKSYSLKSNRVNSLQKFTIWRSIDQITEFETILCQ